MLCLTEAAEQNATPGKVPSALMFEALLTNALKAEPTTLCAMFSTKSPACFRLCTVVSSMTLVRHQMRSEGGVGALTDGAQQLFQILTLSWISLTGKYCSHVLQKAVLASSRLRSTVSCTRDAAS